VTLSLGHMTWCGVWLTLFVVLFRTDGSEGAGVKESEFSLPWLSWSDIVFQCCES
jgi:hypothetical protein